MAEDVAKEGMPEGVRMRRKPVEPRIAALEDAFQSILGTMVRIRTVGSGKGRLEIHFYSDDDLNRLCELLGVEI